MPKSKFIKVFKPSKVQTVFEDGFDHECYIKCYVQTVYKIERISSLSSSTEMEVQEEYKEEMAELDAKIECMNLWCQGMKIAMMPFEKPRAVGGLPEAWSAEVHHFMTTIHRRVQEMEPIYQRILNSEANVKHEEANLNERVQNMRQKWEGVKMETIKRKEQLEDKLNETIAFQEKLQSFDDWLSCTENMLANLPPVCRRTPNLRAQKREQDALQSDIKCHREALKALKDQRSPLINGQKKDASLINNLLTSLEHRLEGISIKVDNRSRQLKTVLSAHAKFSPSPVRKPAAAAE